MPRSDTIPACIRRMSYRPIHGTSPEFRAIASSALKAAIIGAVPIATIFALGSSLPPYANDFALSRFLMLLSLSLAIAFVAGAIATGLCLTLAGSFLARLMGQRLDTLTGFAIVLSAAIIASIGFAMPFDEPMLALVCLLFAVPAAILYRREVLLERALDEA